MFEIRGRGQLIKILLTALVTLFLAWQLSNVFYGEKITAGNGLGWDGVLYAQLAHAFPDFFFNHRISIYIMQRILPSATIYYALKILHISVAEQSMAVVFGIYNTIMLSIACIVWYKLGSLLKWQIKIRYISFAGLFFSYALLKMTTFYPVLTDPTAFVISLIMLYFYFKSCHSAVLITGVIGALTYPTFLYLGIVLFLFPRRNLFEKQEKPKRISKSAIMLACFQAILIVGLIYRQISLSNSPTTIGYYYDYGVIVLSFVSLWFFLLLGLAPFNQHYKLIISYMHPLPLKRVLISLAVIVLFKKSIVYFSSGAVGPLNLSIFLNALSYQSIAYPLSAFISHIMYYGPILCLAASLWWKIVREIQLNDFGLFIILLFSLVISIGSESRQFINLLPFIVVATAQYLNHRSISWLFTAAFTVCSLLISRFWLPLNHSVWPSLLNHPPATTLEFPLQWFFMSFGPWLSPYVYPIFLMVCAMLMILTVYSVKHEIK